LYRLLLAFVDVLAFTDAELGRTTKLCHTITTEEKYPIRSPPQQMSVVHKEEVHQLIQNMLSHEIIQPSTRKEERWLTKILCGLQKSQCSYKEGCLPPSSHRRNSGYPVKITIVFYLGPAEQVLAGRSGRKGSEENSIFHTEQTV